jgi:hypothetical protein
MFQRPVKHWAWAAGQKGKGDDMEVAPAIVMVGLIFATVFLIGWSLLFRYKKRELEHRERLAALEKGEPLPAVSVALRAPWSPRVYLLRGMIWLFTGIALTTFLAGVAAVSQRPLSLEDRARHANWLKQAGASEEQVRAVWQDTSPQNGPMLALAFIHPPRVVRGPAGAAGAAVSGVVRASERCKRSAQVL